MNGPKPDWLRVTLPSGTLCGSVGSLLARKGLHTVCESARCPNKAECWGSGTATFLILGNTCTRSCRFCAVPSGRTGDKVDPDEPRKLAEAVGELCLSYAVLTCVDRDDLPDRGAGHFAACVRTIRKSNPGVRVEVLIPDYHEGEIEPVLEAGPDSVAHNVETIPRLQRIRDVRASYEASLHTLRLVAAAGVPVVKSSLFLGLGESRPEVLAVLDDLRMAGCNGVVLGQYLQPTAAQAPVTEWVLPAAFADLAREARARGFTAVVSGPLARTSYHASRAFREGGTP